MASWKEALQIGERFEKFVMYDILAKTGFESHKNDIRANFKYYDIEVPKLELTIECKCDERAEETQNICIETHSDGNESGILVTKADYWMVTDNVQGFLIKTSELKRCVNEGFTALYPEEPTKFLHLSKYPVKQEDGSVKLMDFYTIPVRIFKEYCDEVNDIDKMTYKALYEKISYI